MRNSPFYQLLDDLDGVREARAQREYPLQKSEQAARIHANDAAMVDVGDLII